MRQVYPLISCICITDSRIAMLTRAIDCFEAQNYPNKELIISYPKTDNESKLFLDKHLKHSEFKLFKIEREDLELKTTSISSAISKCNGDYICIWNDIDWHHPSRLSFQYNSMETILTGYKSSILIRIILYDPIKQKVFKSFSNYWKDTILFEKSLIREIPFDFYKNENSSIIMHLNEKKLLYQISNSEFLYISSYNAGNLTNIESLDDNVEITNFHVPDAIISITK